jgi:hypothetical protein
MIAIGCGDAAILAKPIRQKTFALQRAPPSAAVCARNTANVGTTFESVLPVERSPTGPSEKTEPAG